MSDSISTPLMFKLLAGVGGLIGGVSFMAFLRPCNVWDASVRSGISVISAITKEPRNDAGLRLKTRVLSR